MLQLSAATEELEKTSTIATKSDSDFGKTYARGSENTEVQPENVMQK